MEQLRITPQSSTERVTRSYRISPSAVQLVIELKNITGLSQGRILEEALRLLYSTIYNNNN